jgi:hypothetical protein
MTPEPDVAAQQTVRQPVPPYATAVPAPQTGPAGPEPRQADPLAKITMSPGTFRAVLAVAALLLGLLLALLPVTVANADAANPGYVTCGNTIGGVETGPLSDHLGRPGEPVLATYVNTCESAVATRLAYSWPLFFAGALAIVWSGVVRRPVPTAPGTH